MPTHTYVRFALTEREYARLLEVLDHIGDEPVVLKPRAKNLTHRAKRAQAVQDQTEMPKPKRATR